MSVVTLEDKTNALLKRRELICIFRGQAGKIRRSDAAQLLSKELKLGKKYVIPISLRCETGKADLEGTFYVYDDEDLAKKHLPKHIFERLAGKKEEQKKEGKAAAGEEKKAEGVEKKPVEKKAEEKVEKKEEKKEEAGEKLKAEGKAAKKEGKVEDKAAEKKKEAKE